MKISDQITIRQTDPSAVPYTLFEAADDWTEAIRDYTRRGKVHVAYYKGEIIGQYVLLPTKAMTAEIASISVEERYRTLGVGKMLIEHAKRTARSNGYKMLEIATADIAHLQLALYQKCGFDIYSVDFDYFRRHYPKQVLDNGMECRHQIRMKLDLV